MAWRRSLQHKRVKPKRKVKLERLGLRALEQPVVSMDEIRRQGLLLAGRTLGPSIRPQHPVPSGPAVRSAGPATAARRGRRDAAQ
jgi:hypothetical protein